MKKNNEVFLIRYRVDNEPFYKIVNSNFKFEENAMKKVRELRQDKSVSEVVVNKRQGYKNTKIYSWDNGFESIYLNKRVA